MDSFANAHGGPILTELIKAIQDNAGWLSEIDGAIGDGDHGINMSKGFGKARERLPADVDLSTGLNTLGDTLMVEIGGAMGPLYGTLFMEMAAVCKGKPEIDRELFGQMLDAGLSGVRDIGGASVGDKTLVDTLSAARDAYTQAVCSGATFAAALKRLSVGAESGRDSTRDLVAKIGRASRLGERSRGVLDAGATSCCVILQSMAASMIRLLE